jgi:cellulose synthase/poly-beta-1,6-N-acetylglucosamine synthase-like glycosyltransferase
MITMLALVLAAPLTIMNLLVIAELVAGCLPARPVPLVMPEGMRVAILIPAHDEEIDIASTVRATLAGAPLARVIVIADNCTDATASQAHTAGAEVIIRNDLTAIGKGYALAFGRAHLEAAAPDFVVLLDADTQAQPDAVDHLVRAAAYYQRAVQGSYWLECDTAASARVKISAAAFFLTNVIRVPGLDRIVKASVLTGSGIAVPWTQFMRLPLATGHIAEDLMLGIWLLEQGTPPRFAPLANVVGRASSNAGTATQRDRWESGRNQVVADSAMRLLRQAVVDRSWAHGWMALRLLTPPLSTLVALNAAFAMIAMLSLTFFGVAWVHPAQLISFIVLLLAVPGALTLHGRSDLTAALANALPYTIWKLGRALVRRSKPSLLWQRTDRGR